MDSNTEVFLEKYKELEDYARNAYNYPDNVSAIKSLEERREFATIKSDLAYFRSIRNVLSHKPKVKGSYGIEVSSELIALLDNAIYKIKNPLKIRNVAVSRKNVFCQTMDDYVYPVMKEMLDRTFTHIPIVDDDVVVGVFSENTLLSYIVDDQIIEIDEKMKFSQLKKYLDLNNHKAESFRFVPQNMLLSDVQDLFENALKNSDRIGMIFVTPSGKPTEKIVGIATAWDIIGKL